MATSVMLTNVDDGTVQCLRRWSEYHSIPPAEYVRRLVDLHQALVVVAETRAASDERQVAAAALATAGLAPTPPDP